MRKYCAEAAGPVGIGPSQVSLMSAALNVWNLKNRQASRPEEKIHAEQRFRAYSARTGALLVSPNKLVEHFLAPYPNATKNVAAAVWLPSRTGS